MGPLIHPPAPAPPHLHLHCTPTSTCTAPPAPEVLRLGGGDSLPGDTYTVGVMSVDLILVFNSDIDLKC